MALRFSQRMGLRDVRSVIQKDSMDDPLRNRLWDVVRTFIAGSEIELRYTTDELRSNYRMIWQDFWERPADEVPDWTSSADSELRRWYFRAEWHDVYDLVEFLIGNCNPRVGNPDQVLGYANAILEKYLSAYRFVGRELVPITDEQAIQAIEGAAQHPLKGVHAHISNSLQLIGNRIKPDAANSIKESVSAVESICSAIVGKKATLGDALKQLKDAGVVIHPALERGWKAIYGWTSVQASR